MLMHNAPPTSIFSQTRGQSKFQLFPLAVPADARAPSNGRGERHVFPRSDLYVSKVKRDWLLGPGQELFPARHVGFQPTRHQCSRHIEQQDLGVMVGSNPLPITFANGFSLSLTNRSNICNVLGRRLV
jgi:hypothetical protein